MIRIVLSIALSAAILTAIDGWKYIAIVPSAWSQMNTVLERAK